MLQFGNLEMFDTIVVGVRALETRANVAANRESARDIDDAASRGRAGRCREGLAQADDSTGEVVVLVERGFVPHRVEQSVVIVLPPAQVGLLTDGSAGEKAAAAVEAAALAFKTWSQVGPSERRALLLKAAEDQPRILRDPKPVSRMMGFNDYGFDLELRFWIADPQEGVNNVRSDVNRAIWRLFKENGIMVPVAQREVVLEMRERSPIARDV